ncbi:protein-tyrosine phosphatase-like protein [Mycena rosella]|uniref:protein-tyrosine-phosphatase n=1 Tax=Mycena rosella TaxID=1033263 RepID=A0AAD7GP04_MYCRO|nr:protein-tyrosine phosphatase-like protein [Mycena rosella]
MMISFDKIPADEMEAMCTPMHRVLSPVPFPTGATAGPNAKTPVSGPKPQQPPAPTPAALAGTGPSTPAGALYLGSLAAACEPDLLRTHHIRHLVQVLEVPWAPADSTADYACYRIDIEDSARAALRPHLAGACDYIRGALRAGDNVLVHCHQGVSRSASIVIAYLIRERGMSYQEAHTLVRRQRRCIRPNAGFETTLREWETACRAAEKAGGRVDESAGGKERPSAGRRASDGASGRADKNAGEKASEGAGGKASESAGRSADKGANAPGGKPPKASRKD